MKSKNILLINDLPGYGKVALSAMLPILSKMGYSLYNLPTALVSNTLDYGKFEILDTTSYMENTIKVWNELEFQFDCISTGFILSSKQVDIITNYIKSQNNPNLLVVVDPIMGDDGKLYNGITQETVSHMKELSSYADILIPNYTEAAFIADLFTDKPSLTKTEVNILIDKLISQGSKSVVITSIIEKDSKSPKAGSSKKTAVKKEAKGGIHGKLEKAKAEIKAKEAEKVPKNKSKDLATAL